MNIFIKIIFKFSLKSLLFLASLNYCVNSFSQNIPVKTAEDYLKERGEVYFRFINKQYDIEKITDIISIDRIRKDTIYAYANSEEFESFLTLKLNYEVLIPASLKLKEEKFRSEVSQHVWSYYPGYDEYLGFLDSFSIKYPEICQLNEIGTSVKGRKLMYVKITSNRQPEGFKPGFLFTSSIHGDELTGYVLMLHLIDYLLTNYGTDSLATQLVDNVEIWINPLANPDGTFFSGNNSVEGATRDNANNIDLNRNYPDPENGDHPDGKQWQPETSASMDFMQSHQIILSANYHGGSEILNYPWDTWPRLHPDDNWFSVITGNYADTARKYGGNSYFTDVSATGFINGYDWYSIHGGRQDYMTYFMHGREVTIEVSMNKTPPEDDLISYWNYNYKSMLSYISDCLYGIRGKVTDSLTGAPIKAKVEVEGHDADNSFVYSNVENGYYYRMIFPGGYDLKFSSPGYLCKTIQNINVDGYRSVSELNVQLKESTNQILVIPNPFKTSPEILFTIPSDGNVSLIIYNYLGQKIYQTDNQQYAAGEVHFRDLNMTNFDRGIYFCKINFNGSVLKVMRLVKL